MNDLRKAAQQMLDAVEHHGGHLPWTAFLKVRKDLRAALQDEGKQEPVAWLGFSPRSGTPEFSTDKPSPSVLRDFKMRPLEYADTATPQRPLLTDEEIDKATTEARDALLDHIYEYGTTAEGILERVRKLSRAIERKVRGEE
jgi:hypothetical protein